MRNRIRVLVALTALSAGPAFAERVEYVLDPIHTRIAFTAGHAGFSKAIGTFSGTTGTLSFDEADWKSSKVDATIRLASLDLGESDWNKRVLGNLFLDVAGAPTAHFVSTQVEDLGAGKLKITGNLTLRGKSQPVVLDATFNAHKRHPLTFRQTAGFSATTHLSRKAFGLTAWPGVIDDRVDVMIELEASKPKKARASDIDASKEAGEGTSVPASEQEAPAADSSPSTDEETTIPPTGGDADAPPAQ